jgi:hypothetical protein
MLPIFVPVEHAPILKSIEAKTFSLERLHNQVDKLPDDEKLPLGIYLNEIKGAMFLKMDEMFKGFENYQFLDIMTHDFGDTWCANVMTNELDPTENEEMSFPICFE